MNPIRPAAPFRRILPGLLPILLSTAASAGDIPPGPGVDPLIADEAIVRLEPPTTLQSFLQQFNQFFPGTTVIGAIESRQIYKLALPEGANPFLVDDVLDDMKDVDFIDWGELNYEGQAGEGKTGSLWVSQLDVDASAYHQQYAFELLRLNEAHKVSRGQGVIVAVLDTGVDASHPELAGKVLEGASFVFESAMVNEGDRAGACDGPPTMDVGDCIDNDGDGLVDEMVGHGTFVAGLIALTAPEAKILPVVVLDSEGVGDMFSIAQGIFYAIDHGATIVNCSFGSTYDGEPIEDAVIEARSKGILVIGAAGNFDRSFPPEYPATFSQPMGVAATDINDLKAPFSNFGAQLDLSAPGHSTSSDGKVFDPAASVISTVPGGGYVIWSGTSFANAFVSGAAALVRAQHPEWPATTATAIANENALTSTAVNIDSLNPEHAGQLGAGRLDAAAATALAGPAPRLGDLDANGVIDGDDLGQLLAQWGPCAFPGACTADLDVDGDVDGGDLGLILAAWGR